MTCKSYNTSVEGSTDEIRAAFKYLTHNTWMCRIMEIESGTRNASHDIFITVTQLNADWGTCGLLGNGQRMTLMP